MFSKFKARFLKKWTNSNLNPFIRVMDHPDHVSPALKNDHVKLNLNPFLIDKIVECVLSKINVDEMKNARGISKLWELKATDEIQENSGQIKATSIFCEDKFAKFLSDFERSKVEAKRMINNFVLPIEFFILHPNIEKFFNEFRPQVLKINLFEEFYFNEEDFNHQNHENMKRHLEKHKSMKTLMRILELASPWVKTLDICGLCESSITKIKFTECELPKVAWRFPRLVTFVTDVDPEQTYANADQTRVMCEIIEKVTSNAPRFESLEVFLLREQLFRPFEEIGMISKLVDVSMDINLYDVDMLKKLVDLSKKGGLKLKTFNAGILEEGEFPEEHLGFGGEGDFELNTGICLRGIRYFEEFLTLQAPNLIKLNLGICRINRNLNQSQDEDMDMDLAPHQNQNQFAQNDDENNNQLEVINENHHDHYKTTRHLINLPIFPNLIKLIILNEDSDFEYSFPFRKINLTENFPSLQHISLKDFEEFESIFTGSSTSVKTLTFSILFSDYFEEIPNFTDLEEYFPQVGHFKMKLDKDLYSPITLETIPWHEKLKTLTLKLEPLHILELDFDQISQLKVLDRIEFVNIRGNIRENPNTSPALGLRTYDIIKKCPIKSLRIKDFWMHQENLDLLNAMYILDYNCTNL